MIAELEAQRKQNTTNRNGMMVSTTSSVVRMDYNFDEEDEEWPIERHIRLQEEEEAATRGRLTAPPHEIQQRRPKKKQMTKNDLQIDELRAKQIVLVDEQIYLHKIQQENATATQEKIQEELALIKTQRGIAELELNEKQEAATIAKEKSQFEAKLIKLQCEIAENELRQKYNSSN